MKHIKYFENIYDINKDENRLLTLSYHENELTLPIFKKFLDEHKNININVQNADRGWTPLLIAVNNNGFEFAKMLLDRGADPNIFSNTPELGKFPFDNDSVMKKMIDTAHELDHQSNDFINEYWNFLDTLIPFTDLDKQTEIFKRTPLIIVAENIGIRINTEVGLKLMKNFLKEKPNLSIKDNKDYDFIDHLIRKSNYDIIEELSNEFNSVDLLYKSKKFNI